MTETLAGVSPLHTAEALAIARELVRSARARGVAMTGPTGLLQALTKTVIETAMDEEMVGVQGVGGEVGQALPAISALLRNAWEQFVPFLEYDPEIRTVL